LHYAFLLALAWVGHIRSGTVARDNRFLGRSWRFGLQNKVTKVTDLSL